MIKKFVEAWNENKDKLEEHLKNNTMGTYSSYYALVKLLFDIVINPANKSDWDGTQYDTENIHIIDDGEYQGTSIYLLHLKTYQPSIDEYVLTHVYYGSCSGCDTLQGIHEYAYEERPNDSQLKALMTLCLHLLQRCKYLAPREDEEAEVDDE